MDCEDAFASPEKKIQRLSFTSLKANGISDLEAMQRDFNTKEEMNLSVCFDEMTLFETSVGTFPRESEVEHHHSMEKIESNQLKLESDSAWS